MAVGRQSVTVYEDLKGKIERGEYSPGESLPETELASGYGVSRNTVKKVLLMLERDSLVSVELNKTAKVRSYSLQEVLDFLELRCVMEGFIARLAAGAIGDAELARLREILDAMGGFKARGDLVSYSRHNLLFHGVVYGACPNATAVSLLTALKQRMAKYNMKTILVPGRSDSSLSEHASIYEALKNRNGDLAELFMRRHIENVRAAFRENYRLLFY
jgi:DNA-binding GntR family transcriptional regulator